MQLPLPLLKNVVLVGGGHAHALLLRRWAMKPVAGAQLTLINPGPTAPYTGMLPGFVAGHYERDELDIDLVRLARFAGARLVIGTATNIDRDAKTITVAGRPPIPYDLCSIDVGITSEMPDLPGFATHGLAAKPLGNFADSWVSFIDHHLATGSKATSVAVVGGGIGGCELAMAMNHRLRGLGISPNVTIVDRSLVADDVGPNGQVELRKTVAAQGITIIEHTEVTAITEDGVQLADRTVEADLVVGAAGARPYPWLSTLGLDHHDGFLVIDDTLRCRNDRSIFAVGDCAHMAFDPRPKAGVFAVRQAPVLTHNIQAVLTGGSLKSFDPQSDYLKLISLGGKSAAADKFKRFAQSPKLWRLKDKIDRDFMDKLGDLPEMEAQPLPNPAVSGLKDLIANEPPLCGGCGAKVGVDVLAGPLGELPASHRSDVIRLPGDDAALLDMGVTKQVLTTDQLRTFTADPFRMATIATLHALGDIWAMGADPQAVLVTITLPHMSSKLQEEWLREIMAGTSKALDGTGGEVVGGHTSMGAELTIGYSITGLLDRPAITLAGAEPGQTLILTRPLGSGILFAGEMQRKARGADIAALLDELERPQGESARLLANAGATAMTDVTGFGLAGHLYGICRESNVRADIILDGIEVFDGALELSQNGLRSHLHASNAQAVPVVERTVTTRAPIVYDPQTAGGFLAAVPANTAGDVVAELRARGDRASIVGQVLAGDPQIQVV